MKMNCVLPLLFGLLASVSLSYGQYNFENNQGGLPNSYYGSNGGPDYAMSGNGANTGYYPGQIFTRNTRNYNPVGQAIPPSGYGYMPDTSDQGDSDLVAARRAALAAMSEYGGQRVPYNRPYRNRRSGAGSAAAAATGAASSSGSGAGSAAASASGAASSTGSGSGSAAGAASGAASSTGSGAGSAAGASSGAASSTGSGAGSAAGAASSTGSGAGSAAGAASGAASSTGSGAGSAAAAGAAAVSTTKGSPKKMPMDMMNGKMPSKDMMKDKPMKMPMDPSDDGEPCDDEPDDKNDKSTMPPGMPNKPPIDVKKSVKTVKILLDFLIKVKTALNKELGKIKDAMKAGDIPMGQLCS